MTWSVWKREDRGEGEGACGMRNVRNAAVDPETRRKGNRGTREMGKLRERLWARLERKIKKERRKP